jgi:hypothetical protein
MYIITIDGREEGAYSVVNEQGEQVLYMFEEEDDATRFALMLGDKEDYPEMNVTEVDDNLLIMACDHQGYKYAVFTPNDIVIPPEESDKDDFI